VLAESKDPGDSTTTATNNLTFTGRIHIYYENPMSLEQMLFIEQAFNKNNLTVELRGEQWRQIYQNDRREMPLLR
jgi:hypothetical protein